MLASSVLAQLVLCALFTVGMETHQKLPFICKAHLFLKHKPSFKTI